MEKILQNTTKYRAEKPEPRKMTKELKFHFTYI
jgi:hypothetical protein